MGCAPCVFHERERHQWKQGVYWAGDGIVDGLIGEKEMSVYLRGKNCLIKVVDYISGNTDFFFSVLLFLLSYFILTNCLLDWSKEQSAAAAGALFSGAALLFGNWINRWSTTRRASDEAARRQEESLRKLKLMLAGEFQMLALGLADALKLLHAANVSRTAGGSVSKVPITKYLPPAGSCLMDSSNIELSALDEASLKALMNLRHNIWVSRNEFEDLSVQSEPTMISLGKVLNGTQHTMQSLQAVIKQICPDFQSDIKDGSNMLLQDWIQTSLEASS